MKLLNLLRIGDNLIFRAIASGAGVQLQNVTGQLNVVRSDLSSTFAGIFVKNVTMPSAAGGYTNTIIAAASQSTNMTFALPPAQPVANGLVLTGNTDGSTRWAAGGSGSGQTFPPTGDLAMGGNGFTGLRDPVSAQEAVTKAYLEAHAGSVSAVTASGVLSATTGSTPNITVANAANNMVLAGDPVGSMHAPAFRSLVAADLPALSPDPSGTYATPASIVVNTRGYVTSVTAGAAVFPATGNLAMGGYKLTGLADPTAAQDAATKSYVDAHGGSGASLSVRQQSGTALTGISVIEFATGTTVTDLTGGAVRVTPPSGGGGGAALYNPDTPPSSPNTMDDEFNGTTLDGKWTWYSQGSTTYTIANSRLQLVNTGTSNYGSFIAQPISVTSWTIASRQVVNYMGANYGLGLHLYNSSSGVFTQLCNFSTSSTWVNEWNNFSGSYNGSPIQYGSADRATYFKISRASDVLTFYYSLDGVQYVALGTRSVAAFMGAVTHVGCGAYNSSIGAGSVDWFRRLA